MLQGVKQAEKLGIIFLLRVCVSGWLLSVWNEEKNQSNFVINTIIQEKAKNLFEVFF